MDVQEVSYKDGRLAIKDGDVVFLRGRRTLIGKIIQFVTRSVYSHVGIAFWATIGKQERLFMVECQGNTKKRIVNMSFYQDCNMDIISTSLPWENISNYALNNIGVVKYGYIEAIYVGLREFLMLYFNIRLPAHDFKGQICSEFVADTYGMIERHVSPAMLLSNMINKGNKIKIKIRKSL